jgi:dinuclear metal center YbgI/SA1388 family protein
MSTYLTEVISRIEKFAPPSLAEFDYAGLLLGDRNKRVRKVGLTLDFSLLAMKKAVDLGCDALITHHGPKSFSLPVQGNMAKKINFAVKNDLPVYRAHLNLDFCPGGIIETLCVILDIPTKETTLDFYSHKIRNGVRLSTKKMTLDRVLEGVKKLNPGTIRLAGPKRTVFNRIAITSGAGFFEEFMGQLKGIDLYIAGEFEQEAVKAAEDMGITLLELTHHASEARPLELMAPRLSHVLGVDVEFIEISDSIRNVDVIEKQK